MISDDESFMERALFLAERGRPATSPNPVVGAVIVSPAGIVVGQGAHLKAGGPHAEVHALNDAGSRARDATLYCTLEPCCHVGRTGPCVERIAAAGIARVVAAIEDPHLRVAGKGFEYLRSRGIAVEVGVGAAEAARQNAPFFTSVHRRRPLVILKTAVSANGYVGRRDVRIKLTGDAADRWFQRQRAEIDAIAVGAGTMLVDNPLLTARDVYRARPLTRVIFDWRVRIAASARVFSTLASGPIVLVVSTAVAAERDDHLAALAARGVDVQRCADRDLRSVLARLGAMNILSLLVEGGPELQTAFVRGHLVDRVQCVTTSHPLAAGVAAPAIVRHTPEGAHRRRLGDDILTEFDVHGSH